MKAFTSLIATALFATSAVAQFMINTPYVGDCFCQIRTTLTPTTTSGQMLLSANPLCLLGPVELVSLYVLIPLQRILIGPLKAPYFLVSWFRTQQEGV